MIRTRFAPSPTGYLHIGGVRTALYSWAFARHHGGQFILRIEDTDLERSTPESVQAILDGMHWVGLNYDEGPFFQTQRMERYREVIGKMLADGSAYHCYCSREELDALRAEQEARGEKMRYDGRWRPEPGKVLPAPPAGVKPVVRFRNPQGGSVAWDDAVKGRIEISNDEMDDLIIARDDGSPTYNFCVVVDDWDMGITHVIRGDDHVNNTPRQINILHALGAPLPIYGHLPMILREDGKKMSKRRDPVSVVEFDAMGFLPEAMLNYLARLGWGHGDDEFFGLKQFVEWFSLEAVSPSPARFDKAKLLWVNQQHMKALPAEELAKRVAPRLLSRGLVNLHRVDLAQAVALLRERASTLEELADLAALFYRQPAPDAAVVEQHLGEDSRALLQPLVAQLVSVAWEAPALHELIQNTVKAAGVKMPKIAMPLRVALFGTPNTPSIDAMLALLGREEALARLREAGISV